MNGQCELRQNGEASVGSVTEGRRIDDIKLHNAVGKRRNGRCPGPAASTTVAGRAVKVLALPEQNKQLDFEDEPVNPPMNSFSAPEEQRYVSPYSGCRRLVPGRMRFPNRCPVSPAAAADARALRMRCIRASDGRSRCVRRVGRTRPSRVARAARVA
jgi:hypothetical protein